MTKRSPMLFTAVLLLALSLVLVACGGGNPTATPPAAAPVVEPTVITEDQAPLEGEATLEVEAGAGTELEATPVG